MPTFSFLRKLNETWKQPSPSTSPLTYHGSSMGFFIGSHFLLFKGTSYQRIAQSKAFASNRASPFGSVVTGSMRIDHLRGQYGRLPSGLPSALHTCSRQEAGGFPRYEPVILCVLTNTRGNVIYPTRNFARLFLTVSRKGGLYLKRPRFI